jgi:hypothetical protein
MLLATDGMPPVVLYLRKGGDMGQQCDVKSLAMSGT